MGTNMPLYYHKGISKSTVRAEGEEEVKAILKHRFKEGKIEFLTRWAGIPHSEDSWEPASTFVEKFSPTWLDYLKEQGLGVDISKLLGGR